MKQPYKWNLSDGYPEKNGYKVKELNYQEGDVAGIKTVTLQLDRACRVRCFDILEYDLQSQTYGERVPFECVLCICACHCVHS